MSPAGDAASSPAPGNAACFGSKPIAAAQPIAGTSMARIIAGVFETMTEAERTREALAEAGFADGDMTSFFNNAPGQHGELATGGDEVADPGARGLQKGTAAGAAAGAGI